MSIEPFEFAHVPDHSFLAASTSLPEAQPRLCPWTFGARLQMYGDGMGFVDEFTWLRGQKTAACGCSHINFSFPPRVTVHKSMNGAGFAEP